MWICHACYKYAEHSTFCSRFGVVGQVHGRTELAIAEHVSRQDSMRHTKHILAIGRHLEHFLYNSCFVWKVRYIKSIISNPLSPRWYWYDAIPWQTGTSKHVWHPGPTFHRVSQPQVCFWCRSRQLWKALAGAYGRWVASNKTTAHHQATVYVWCNVQH